MTDLGRAIRLLSRTNLVWSLALYVADEPFSPEMLRHPATRVFNSRQLALGRPSPHTRADPFLFERDGALYLFHEVVLPRGHGKIAAFRTRDLVDFEDLGIILDEPHHLSFPYVFTHDGAVFMLPEASRGGGVPLYRFEDFPRGLKKTRDVVAGAYCDSFLLERLGLWYLFTTSPAGLEIHVSDDLLRGEFRPHSLNPVCVDLRFNRSAGATLTLGGRLCRVAQDCSTTYGRNVSVLAIDELTPETYRETLRSQDIFDLRQPWNSNGAHHVSATMFLGRTVVAVDGKHPDLYINRFARALPPVPSPSLAG
jgi:hypothetical protein